MTNDECRKAAFDLLAEWMDLWDKSNSPMTTSFSNRKDLEKYSSPYNDHHILHDHNLRVFKPSVGDEAGYWTLYVFTNMSDSRITYMMQVFDTYPNPIYDNQLDKPEGGKFVQTPQED